MHRSGSPLLLTPAKPTGGGGTCLWTLQHSRFLLTSPSAKSHSAQSIATRIIAMLVRNEVAEGGQICQRRSKPIDSIIIWLRGEICLCVAAGEKKHSNGDSTIVTITDHAELQACTPCICSLIAEV
jgi:hypothetical protein